MDRKDTLVSTEDDKDREELHIRNALKSCGYPKWIFDKVKHDQCQKRKKTIDTKKRNKSAQESKGLAVIPYVEGLSKTAERILRKCGINTAMKPYRTLRQLLVHPKDQRTVEQTGECVYCTGFRATTVTVHILERPAEIMGRDKRNTEKK